MEMGKLKLGDAVLETPMEVRSASLGAEHHEAPTQDVSAHLIDSYQEYLRTGTPVPWDPKRLAELNPSQSVCALQGLVQGLNTQLEEEAGRPFGHYEYKEVLNACGGDLKEAPLQELQWSFVTRIALPRVIDQLGSVVAMVPLSREGFRPHMPMVKPGPCQFAVLYAFKANGKTRVEFRIYRSSVGKNGEVLIGGAANNTLRKNGWAVPGVRPADELAEHEFASLLDGRNPTNMPPVVVARFRTQANRAAGKTRLRRGKAGMVEGRYPPVKGLRLDFDNEVIFETFMSLMEAVVARGVRKAATQQLDLIGEVCGHRRNALKHDPTLAGEKEEEVRIHLSDIATAELKHIRVNRLIVPQHYVSFDPTNVPKMVDPEALEELSGLTELGLPVRDFEQRADRELLMSHSGLTGVYEDHSEIFKTCGSLRYRGSRIRHFEEDGTVVSFRLPEDDCDAPARKMSREAYRDGLSYKLIPQVVDTGGARLPSFALQWYDNGVTIDLQAIKERFKYAGRG